MRIAIEGIDGAGKDTQTALLLDFFKQKGIDVQVVKVPDPNRPVGKVIHQFLEREIELSPVVQFLLYTADHRHGLDQVQGEGTVIFNRYVTSTLAYQGSQGAVSLEKGKLIVEACGFPALDIIFYLAISADTSIQRKREQKAHPDRFESDRAFQEQLLGSYQQLIDQQVLGKWISIDGEQSPEQVHQAIIAHL